MLLTVRTILLGACFGWAERNRCTWSGEMCNDSKTSYNMPWAIYSIPLSSIRDNLPSGKLTHDGMELVADAIDDMIR